MRSMRVQAFLDVTSVEIHFEGPSESRLGFGGGGRVTARVNVHQGVDGKPYVHANPHTMALSMSATPELLEAVKNIIEASGLDAMLGTYDTEGAFHKAVAVPYPKPPHEGGLPNFAATPDKDAAKDEGK